MTSSSSLYGTPPNQDVSSTNSTSLYGGADTPIPDSSGNLVVRGDLLVLSGNILTTATTGNIFPANATTINLGNAATTVNIGASTGTTTINNDLSVGGDVTAEGGTFGNVTVGVVDNNTIDNAVGALTISSGANSIVLNAEYISNPNPNAFLFNSPTTVVAFDSATSLTMGDTTGTTTIRNDLDVGGDLTINGTFIAPDAQFGNITLAVTDDNTIGTTTGPLQISSATNEVGLIGVDTLYTDQSSFLLLNAPTTVVAFDSATSLTMGDVTGTTLIRNDVTVGGDLRINGNDIKSSSGSVAITLSGNDVVIADDLTITGNNLNLAQGTYIGYSENNDRTTRPTVRSTTGNSSGFRVEAPNNSTNASAAVSAFSTNDADNGKFLNINARGNAITPLRIQTGEYTGGVLGASGDSLVFLDGANAYHASINPAGPTDPLDLTTKAYVDAQVDSNTTYTIDASSTTGGANFNLVGSDSTTDTIKYSSGTGVTVSQVSANEIGFAIGQAVATTDNVTFNSVQTPSVFYSSGVTLQGGSLTPSSVVIDDSGVVSSLTSGVGGDTSTLTINAGLLEWDHVAGPLVVGSVDATWTLNPDGTTSFPNYKFPYADGTNNQVLRTNGSGILSWYSPSDLNTTYTIDATSTTGGANLNLVGSDSTTDTVAFLGSGATTVTRTDANTVTISSTDNNTTYDFAATTATGGVNLNLTGSDSTTDTVKITNGTGVTASYVSGTEVSIAIGQAVGTTDDVQFNSVRTATINANGGVSFVDTSPMGSTYATVNPFGPINATDLVTKSYADALTGTTYTQDASSTTGGANLNLVGSDSTTDSVKFSGGTNVTVTATSANEITIAATDTNTTYTIDASSTTGGANLNLVGSDSTTDTVKIASGTGVTVAQVSANELSVAIGQAVGTGDSPSFAGVTGGNISVGVATDNTITSADTNGDLVLAANGTGDIILSKMTRLQGEMQASTNLNYTFPPQTLTTVTDNNGYSAASSMPAGTNGYGANMTYTHYFGDTLAGNQTTPALQFRTATGNSTTDTVPFTGIAGVAPSAIQSTNTMGTFNFNGYGTTGFSNDIGTQYQGGGLYAMHGLQIQSTAAENFSDATLTVGSANITAVASSFRAAFVAPSVTGTKGQISFNATTPAVGNAVRVTGTLTGTATGIVSGQNYWIIATNGSTTATLSATPNGSPINTTAGTLTGLTLTRCGVTFTLSGQTSVPFGRGALVSVSGVNNVTDGTYPVFGTPTLTAVAIGIPHAVAPTLTGTQSFSCITAYMGSGYRVRAFPLATPANFQNRLEIVNHTPASATFRADTYAFNTGAYGNTGVGVTGDKLVYNRVYGQWQNTTTIVPAASDTAYAFALPTVDFTNIASVGSTSRIIPGAAGMYKLQFSVQVQNDDSAAEHTAYFWWRKNGTDVPGSMGRVGVVKATGAINGLTIAGWDNMISSANATDYWELMYAVDDATHVDFPTFSSTAFGPSTSALFVTLVPIGA